MAFVIVAERDTEIVKMKRDSSLIAIAKARVFASEGWNVTVALEGEAREIQEHLKLLADAS
ncbi:MAG: hypothetical protein ACJ8EF_00640 [Bradyrhizobium sp.]|jgi:hypothetical protein